LSKLLDRYGETIARKIVLMIAWFNLLSRFLNGCRVPLETTDKIGTGISDGRRSVTLRLLCLLGVAVSAKPIEAAGSRQPIVNVGLALEPFDPHGFDAWALGNDLPIAFGDAFHLECHSGGFGHAAL
jgi:hypothetical protein